MPQTDHDAIVIGGGFSGVRTLIELDKLGLSSIAIEAGTDVGGTWYWNRYPGARTDSESWAYCFPFADLERDWDWQERYPRQPEVQRYIAQIVENYDLRDRIRFSTKVEAAHYDDASNTWTIRTDAGDELTCTYFITGLGHLSVPKEPDFDGMDDFEGELLFTSRWPKEGVDLTDKRVGVIGTGASAIQAIPEIAKEAAYVAVFQRTPNYVMPAQNHPLTDEQRDAIRADYSKVWDQSRRHVFGFPMDPANRVYDDVTDEAERERIFEEGWEKGGFHFVFTTFDDLILDQRSNDAAAEFIRTKIRETVDDPATAELLCPKDYPYIAKRPPAGHDYYEAFNRDNVKLLDVNADPIRTLTKDGLQTASMEHEFDVIVFATGFDATTGPFEKIDIRGVGGRTLRDAWAEGPRTQLGVGTPGFPNMFMVCGPQSAYANIPVVIESVVEWLGQALARLQETGNDRMEATDAAADAWTAGVTEVFNMTLLTQGEKVGSWYLGANIPGKARRPLFFFAGAGAYGDALAAAANDDFAGFEMSSSRSIA